MSQDDRKTPRDEPEVKLNEYVEVTDIGSPFFGWQGYSVEDHVGTMADRPGRWVRVLVPQFDRPLMFRERQLKQLYRHDQDVINLKYDLEQRFQTRRFK